MIPSIRQCDCSETLLVRWLIDWNLLFVERRIWKRRFIVKHASRLYCVIQVGLWCWKVIRIMEYLYRN
jgi:hypothetical protein